MWRVAIVTTCTVLLGTMGALATDTTGRSSNPHQLPDSIVVSANRFGQPVGQTIWPVQVIQLDQQPGQTSISDQLEGASGVDIRSYNGDGSVATLSNWGVFNRHMLLLYNGRVVKDYSLGGFNLAEYSSSEIERIELLKGPQSAFFGSDAVGGVVNLVTRPSLADRTNVTVKYGSLARQQYNVDFSRRRGSFGIGAFAEFTGSDNRRDNSGMERWITSVRSDYLSHDERHHASVSARYFKDSLGVPGPVPDPVFQPAYGSDESNSLNANQRDENYSFDASYNYTDESFGEVQFDLFWEKKNLEYSSLYNYQFFYVTVDTIAAVIDTNLNIDSVDVNSSSLWVKRSAGASARYMKELTKTSVAGGVDYLSGSLRVNSDDSSSAFNTVGPYSPFSYQFVSSSFWARGQDQVDFWGWINHQPLSKLRIDLSGRVQFVHNRKSQASFNIGASYRITETVSLKAGSGYAYRLPTIAEQFADDQYTAGNVDLSPETAWTHQFTAQYSRGPKVNFRFTVFNQSLDSLIQYRFDPTVFRSLPVNVEEFSSTGIDVELGLRPLSSLNVNISAVAQKAEQTVDGGTETVDAYHVPKLKWRSDISYKLNRVRVGGNVVYTSTRSILMYGGNRKQLARVYELGGHITYSVSKNLAVSVTGHDLTDQRRADQFGFTTYDGDYPSLGRRFIVEAKMSIL